MYYNNLLHERSSKFYHTKDKIELWKLKAVNRRDIPK